MKLSALFPINQIKKKAAVYAAPELDHVRRGFAKQHGFDSWEALEAATKKEQEDCSLPTTRAANKKLAQLQELLVQAEREAETARQQEYQRSLLADEWNRLLRVEGDLEAEIAAFPGRVEGAKTESAQAALDIHMRNDDFASQRIFEVQTAFLASAPHQLQALQSGLALCLQRMAAIEKQLAAIK